MLAGLITGSLPGLCCVTVLIVNDVALLLAAYDEQLRTDAETPSALAVAQLGSLRLVTYAGGRGLVTYRDLGGADASTIRRLVADVVAHYRADPEIDRVEWKTRAHDHAPGLHTALLDHEFVPGPLESIMIGEAKLLAVEVALPAGVTLRRVSDDADVRAMSAMADEVFGDPPSEQTAAALLRRLSTGDGMQLWVAEADSRVVSAGRLEPVPDTDFAGIWGGATRDEWARPWHLPCADRGSRTVGVGPGQDAHQQRFHRVLATNPRTIRSHQSVDHYAVPLAPLTHPTGRSAAASAGGVGTCWATRGSRHGGGRLRAGGRRGERRACGGAQIRDRSSVTSGY